MIRQTRNDELDRLDIEGFKKAKKMPVTVVLDNVRSMQNIGSFFRTSDAFLIEKILLCGITAKPPHREIHKAALGATESVEWEYYSSSIEAVELLQKENCHIILVEQTSDSVFLENFKVSFDTKYALVFGNEVNGISEELMPFADLSLEIPQSGTKHSLNVSISAGIVLWEFYKTFRP